MEQFRLDPRLRWFPRSGKERGGLAREGGKARVESVEGERRVTKRREDGDMGERERERDEEEDKEGSWRRARRCIRARTSVWGSERMSGGGGGI